MFDKNTEFHSLGGTSIADQGKLFRASVSPAAGCVLLTSGVLLFSISNICAAQSGGWCTVGASSAPREAVAVAEKSVQSRLNAQPQPLADMHSSGQLPHQGNVDAAMDASHELGFMRNAAVAWYAGGGNQYLDMANRYLVAWIDTYQPNYNPIDEMHFDALIDTYSIIKDRMDPAARQKVEAALRSWGNGYIAQIAKHPEEREGKVDIWTNNWQSFRVQLITMIAVALNDKAMFDQARRIFWTHLNVNMKPDGSVIDFDQRDALHYVVYDLQPLLEAALAARAWSGGSEDWYHKPAANGASLDKGMKWLVPYATGQKTHQEFAHSEVQFDAQRAGAGVKGFSGNFDPKKSGNVMWLAAQFDSSYRSIAEASGEKQPPYLAICGH